MRAGAGALRSVADARTARSLPVRAGSGGEPDVHARLTQLARERQRLAGEQDLWRRKLEGNTRRLGGIDSQVQRRGRQAPPPGPAPARPRWREIEFPY